MVIQNTPMGGIVNLYPKKILSQKVKNLGLDEDELIDYLKSRDKKKKKTIVKDTRYHSFFLAELSSRFVGRKMKQYYPAIMKNKYLIDMLKKSDLKILPHSFMNIVVFMSLASLVVSIPLSFLFILIRTGSLLSALVFCPIISLGLFAFTAVMSFFYPLYFVDDKKRLIEKELPFAVMHMTAVSESGIEPTTIFKLIIESSDYPNLSKEFKKILNYINLFGYDFITAIEKVAATTPSEELKGLLFGFTATIKTGGSITSYLAAKSDELMNKYEIIMDKYNKAIAILSDIYVGLIIAAPMLFFVVLAIMSVMGDQFKGVNILSIAYFGTLIIVPALNIVFLIIAKGKNPE